MITTFDKLFSLGIIRKESHIAQELTVEISPGGRRPACNIDPAATNSLAEFDLV
jgi:hypothetical protein